MLTFSNLTVGQIEELYRIHRSTDTVLYKVAKSIQVITGQPLEEIEAMPMDELNKLSAQLTVLFSTVEPVPKIEPVIKLQGRNYSFVLNPDKMQAGDLGKLNELFRGDINANLSQVVAVVLRPVSRFWPFWRQRRGKSGNAEDMAEIAKGVPVMQAVAVALYFIHLWNELLSRIEPDIIAAAEKALNQNPQAEPIRDLAPEILKDAFFIPIDYPENPGSIPMPGTEP